MKHSFVLIMFGLLLIVSCGKEDEEDKISKGFSTAFSDDFNRTDEANIGTSADYTVGTNTNGCELSSNKLLCKSTGGSSGKVNYVSAISGTTIKVTATLSISGGDYNGNESVALLTLSDNENFQSVNSFVGCGIIDGEISIRNESSVLASDSTLDIATDGTSFTVVLTFNGTDITCNFSGSATAEITHTLDSSLDLDYAGLIAGWYESSTQKNYAFWDDFKIEYK